MVFIPLGVKCNYVSAYVLIQKTCVFGKLSTSGLFMTMPPINEQILI